jgi:nucleoside-diphosphate-sugar epimerase
MKFLVTGATGFIGPYLVKELTGQGHFCRCLVRDIEKAAPILPENHVEYVQADIRETHQLTGIADGMDGVFHLATMGHAYNYNVPDQDFFDINVQGTENIAREALASNVTRFVHCSSVAAMGVCKEVPADENTVCRPAHPYGISKLAAEKKIMELIQTQNLPASIVRFSMVYGPGDWRDMLKLVRLYKKGLYPKVGNRPKLTPLIHVTDAVNGLIQAYEKGRIGQLYFLTNETPEKFDDIRQYIAKGLNMKRPVLYVPEWMALTGASVIETLFKMIGKVPPVTRNNIRSTLADRVFSVEKSIKDLGFATHIPAEQGIIETVKWYKEKGWV